MPIAAPDSKNSDTDRVFAMAMAAPWQLQSDLKKVSLRKPDVKGRHLQPLILHFAGELYSR